MARLFNGVGVSGGTAVGRIYLLHAEPLPVVPNPVPPERLDEEIERFHRALATASEEMNDLGDQVREALGDRYAAIVGAQRMILEDPGLITKTEQRIRVGRVSARWALKEVVGEFKTKFDSVDDEYLRERGGELTDVHRRLQRLLRGETPHEHTLPEGPLVVVAHSLGPTDTLLLAREQVMGLATDAGGRTSHTAILAHALSLPAVVGLHDVSRRVRAGDRIILDGDSGRVIVAPSEADAAEAEDRRRESLDRQTRMVSCRDLPAVTRDGVEIAVRANIEFPSEVDRALRFGAQGIGLYRSEFLFLSRSPQLPTEEDHFRTYLEVAEKVDPEPCLIRTLDLGGEKYFHEVLEGHETNPVLGMRGIRFCLNRPAVFRPQLRGLLRAAAIQSNLCCMLPLVTSADQIRAVRELFAEEADKLRQEGFEVRADFRIGAMIEVPAAALAADLLAEEADFFSLGTNDLTQYSLAVDRGNESLDRLYEPYHPGVLRLLQLAVEHADAKGIPVSICGEMAAEPKAVGLLVGMGLTDLSVHPGAVGPVRESVRRLDSRDARKLATAVLASSSAAGVQREILAADRSLTE